MRIIPQKPLFQFKMLTDQPRSPWPFIQNQDKSIVFSYSGAAAIYLSLQALGLQPPGEILLPAYHCGSEVSAVETAGFTPVFYRVNHSLQIDLDDIASRLTGRTKALYFTDFFGFPSLTRAGATFAQQHGLPVIEDGAHGLFSQPEGEPLGALADAAIFSLTKFLPVPDGGLLKITSAKEENFEPKFHSPPLWPTISRFKGLLGARLKLALHRREDIGPAVFPPASFNSLAQVQFEPLKAQWQRSWITAAIFKRIDWQEVASRRRQNYQKLQEIFSSSPNLTGFKPLCPTLPQGVCPSVFPVRVSNPMALKARLRAIGIGAVAFWTYFYPRFDPRAFPEAADLKRHILALPIHQDLQEEDMHLIYEKILQI